MKINRLPAVGAAGAGAGGVGGLVRDLVLLCYGHDLLKGIHTETVVRALQVAGVASVLGIGLLVVRLGRKRAGGEG